MIRSAITLSLATVIALLSVTYSPKPYAFASCSGCFAAGQKFGYSQSCTTCTQAGEAAMQIIDRSIERSQERLYLATGMQDPSGTSMIGFPHLANLVRSSTSKQTNNLRDALDTTTQKLTKELSEVPFTSNTIENEQLKGEAARDYSEDTEQAIKRGSGRSESIPSQMEAITDYRTGTGSLLPDQSQEDSGATDNADQNGEDSPSDFSATQDREQAKVRQIQGLTEKLRENDESTFSELNASLLTADRNRILGNTPTDEDDYSQEQKANLYLKLQSGTHVSNAASRLGGNGANNTSEMDSTVGNAINDMRFRTAIAVQDRYLRMRKLHSKSRGMGEYMREAMPEAAVVMGDNERFDVPSENEGDIMSDEAFMGLTSTYRSRSPQWLAKAGADGKYAIRESAMIEAERLYTKYQRWQAKRELNMMLAQVLAMELAENRPGSDTNQ